MSKPIRRRRRDGISFRAWDDSWYTSISGKRRPLRDEAGKKLKGRQNEAQARTAYLRLALAKSERAASPQLADDVQSILRDSRDAVVTNEQLAAILLKCSQYLQPLVAFLNAMGKGLRNGGVE